MESKRTIGLSEDDYLNILYAGNLVNNGYYHTRQLRNDGVNMELVMEKNPNLAADPLKRDPNLKNIYPQWIRFYDRSKSSWKIDLIKIMRDRKYLLIHAHVEMPIFAYASRRPFIAQVMGSDLAELAFTKSLRGTLLRRAYKKAKLIIFSSPKDPSLFSKLKIKNIIFLPLIWDLSFFRPIKVQDNEFADKFIVFHPASHIWDVKGNDKLIRGFSYFVKNNPNSILIVINHGVDVGKSHELVKSLGIENKVRFINALNSTELLRLYNLSDVIADQFIYHGIGGIGMEAFCCEKPLLVSCHQSAYNNLIPESPPAVNATTSSEVCEQLEYLKDRIVRQDVGKRGRQWMEKYLAPEIISRKSRIIYESVINDKKMEEIRALVSKVH